MPCYSASPAAIAAGNDVLNNIGVRTVSLMICSQLFTNQSTRKMSTKLILVLSLLMILDSTPMVSSQNLTEMITICNQGLQMWEDMATSWRNKFIAYVTISSLLSFASIGK